MKKQKEPKERRIRTQHPGVKLLRRKRETKTIWLARWVDPQSGKSKEVSLTALKKTSEKDRTDWAKDMSEKIHAERAAIKTGKPLPTTTGVYEAFESLFDVIEKELSANTIGLYKRTRQLLEDWCEDQGIAHIEQLTPFHLTAFRDAVLKQRKKEPKPKGKRGQRVANSQPRAARSVNTIINTARALLNHLRRRGRLPNLNGEAILDSLPYMKTQRHAPRFFKPEEIKALMEAVDDHDSDLDDGLGHHRYAIGDFVRTVLLTGLRFSEALALRWEDVDFAEQLIRLPADAAKGGIARLVTLAECPSLLALLKARKERAAERDPWVFSQRRQSGKRVRYEALSRATAESCRKRISKTFPFGWHDLRRCAGTYGANAGGIHGAASVFKVASRLGHTIQVAQRSYYGQVAVPEYAKTLEEAMGLEPAPPKIGTLTSDIVVND